jgi:predicted ferric reductase
VHSPAQPLDNSIGAMALYLLAFVVITSYVRIRLGRHLWKSFHFSIYFAAAALFWHSLFTDPGLKNAPVAWLDGGKLFVESCLLLIATASLLRLRHARKKALRVRPIVQQPAVFD